MHHTEIEITIHFENDLMVDLGRVILLFRAKDCSEIEHVVSLFPSIQKRQVHDDFEVLWSLMSSDGLTLNAGYSRTWLPDLASRPHVLLFSNRRAP